jgi:hypothetical protein
VARPAKAAGTATILALLLLSIFAAMAVAMASTTDTSLQTASNTTEIQQALLNAEGGLSYLTYVMQGLEFSERLEGAELLDAVAQHLSAGLNGAGNLGGATVGYDGQSVVVPTITLDSVGSFDAAVSLPEPTTVRLQVTGRHRDVSRALTMDFALTSPARAIFDYGVAAFGPIRMSGNAGIRGANNANEASILSATQAVAEALKLIGNSYVGGNVGVANRGGHVTMTGNVEVGGTSYSGNHTVDLAAVEEDPETYDPFHIGLGQVAFPEPDPSVFEPFATNIVDASTNTTGDLTFSNIRILADTNKHFSGNITINGVIFIEQPNLIHFSGNTTITGVIVTQDAGDGNYDTNQIKFSGNVTISSVEELPDYQEYHELRQMPGTGILAPGFLVEFTGNFGTVSGCMAAEKFTWAGNAGGIVRGAILSYGQDEFFLTGNSNITIDRTDSPPEPPGFTCDVDFSPVPASYTER